MLPEFVQQIFVWSFMINDGIEDCFSRVIDNSDLTNKPMRLGYESPLWLGPETTPGSSSAEKG